MTPSRSSLDDSGVCRGAGGRGSGPEGMQLSGDGKLTWTPPADFRKPDVGVIITVADASGQEVLHSFVIRIPENAPPPESPKRRLRR